MKTQMHPLGFAQLPYATDHPVLEKADKVSFLGARWEGSNVKFIE